MREVNPFYGPCRRCGRPMASRSVCQQDRAYVSLGSADGYCDSCHKTNLRGRPNDYRRPPVQGWIELAACARPGVDPDWFFPPSGSHEVSEAARFVCAGCPVRERCELDTSATKDRYGVRAGSSAYERSSRRARRAA